MSPVPLGFFHRCLSAVMNQSVTEWPIQIAGRGGERVKRKTVNQNSASSLRFASGSVWLNSFLYFCFFSIFS